MRYVFAFFCLLSLSACQAPAMTYMPAARFASQAALPPDFNHPNPGHPTSPKPCTSNPHFPHRPFGAQAALPPDMVSPKPKPCPCQKPFGAQAFLPPDAIGPIKPPHCS